MINRRSLLKAAAALPIAGAAASVHAAGHAAAHEVSIEGFKFKPANLEIKVGDTVTFTNVDSAPHTATADSGAWTTPTLQKGQSTTLKFNGPGSHPYFCKIHPSMKGSITVSA